MPLKGFIGKYSVIASIIITAFLLYGNTIRNGYSLDDTYVAQNNPKVKKGIAGIPEIFTSRYVDEEGNSFGYRPIAMATFAIEQELWGQNPHMGHFINTLLFALCSMLLYVLIRKIFRISGLLFPLAVTLLFVAHPIHTEVVASLKNRETLLSFLFSLVALSCFMQWMESKRILFVFTGIFSFILAFLSKQDSITFAAVIPLALYYSHQGNLSIKFFKGNFDLEVKRKKFYQNRNCSLWFVLAIICLAIFIPANNLLNIPFLTRFIFAAALLFMIVHYFKTKHEEVKDRNKVPSAVFLVAGIIFHLISAVQMLNPGFFYKSWFPVVSLFCYAVFFFRILDKIKIPAVKLKIKAPGISIPKIWFYLILSIFVLEIAGTLFYKLPNFYLPAENKVVYHFENPQFSNSPGYQTGPLAFYTLYFYLQKLLWPHPLGFYYGYKMIPEVSWTTPEVIFSVVFHMGILLFALWKLPKKHVLSFAILYYFITISIFTNIVIKIPGIVGERMAFFPSLGFCIALVYGIFRVLKIDIRSEQIPKSKTLWLTGIMLLILIPYSAKTITRNNNWKDYLTLFAHDIWYLSNSAKANSTYASQLLKEAFNNEIKNPPAEVQKEYLGLAMKHLRRTVEIDSTFKFGWNNLGYMNYQFLGRPQEAIICLQKALGLDTLYEQAHYNLGYAFRMVENYEQSVVHFRKAKSMDPGNLNNYLGEAETWIRYGRYDSARSLFLKASQIAPESDLPYIGLGNISWLQADTLSAVSYWEKAYDMNQNNILLCRNLLGYYQHVGSNKVEIFSRKIMELESKLK